MSELFNVSTDYLLKDDVENEVNLQKESIDNSSKIGYRKVSMEEAVDFLKMREKNAFRVAMGVALSILSPAALIILLGFTKSETGVSVAVGIAILFILIAISTIFFIIAGSEGKQFKYMTNERIETAYGVRGMVKEKEKDFMPKYTFGFAAGIAICLVSPLPTVMASLLSTDGFLLLAICSSVLILFALGMYLVVKFSMIKESYSVVLREDEFSDIGSAARKKAEAYAPVYWSFITLIYLGYSFYTFNWGLSCIIWVLAGIIWGGISAMLRAKNSN